MVGGDWAPEIPVSSLSLVQCGAAIAGAMEEGSSIAESTARSSITGAIPPAGAEQDRRGARQDEATNVAPKNVHALFFLVVGDIEIETVADRELRMDWWCT